MSLILAMGPLILPLAFLIAASSLVIDNLRTGEITNRDNAILFLVGVGGLLLGRVIGLGVQESPSPWFWVVAVVFLTVSGSRRWIGGGTAKFLMALLPWFPQGGYMFAAITGFVVTGVIGLIRKQTEMQPAPMVVAMGLLVQLAIVADAMAHGPHDQTTQHTTTQPIGTVQ